MFVPSLHPRRPPQATEPPRAGRWNKCLPFPHRLSQSQSVRWTQYTDRARDHTRTIINNIKYTVHKTNNNKPHVFGEAGLRWKHAWRARTKSAKASSADFTQDAKRIQKKQRNLPHYFYEQPTTGWIEWWWCFVLLSSTFKIWKSVEEMEKRLN